MRLCDLTNSRLRSDGCIFFDLFSTKEEKPQLCGHNNKTRKRNIVIPVDPGSFATAIVNLCQEAAEGLTSLDEQLEAGTKAIDGANNLEFSRYADTLFEVFFAGGMVGVGGKLAGDQNAPKLEQNVRLPDCGMNWYLSLDHAHAPCPMQILASEATRDAILPYVKVFASLARYL